MSDDEPLNDEHHKSIIQVSHEYIDGLAEGMKRSEEIARRIADEVKKSLEES